METSCNFHPEKEFFVIDSENLKKTESRLYGFIVTDEMITNDISFLKDSMLSPNGAYVYVKRDGDNISIYQDFSGSYGLYLYRYEDYFAVSNSFIFLVDHVKTKKPISFNKRYADYYIGSGLCSALFSETMVNEINMTAMLYMPSLLTDIVPSC